MQLNNHAKAQRREVSKSPLLPNRILTAKFLPRRPSTCHRLVGPALALTVTAIFAGTPEVTHLIPGALRPGHATQIRFHGQGLDGARAMIFSMGGVNFRFEAATNSPGVPVFDAFLPLDVPCGIGAAWLLGTNGVSNLQWLLVDDLPTVAESSTNRTPASAQLLTPPVAVDGECKSGSQDFYAFVAGKGSRLTVEAVAQRIGSPFLPNLTLRDERGTQLLHRDHDASTGPDARFEHQFKQAGRYLLEVRDARAQANGSLRYRLRMGDFPLVTSPFPIAGVMGDTIRLHGLGSTMDPKRAQVVRFPDRADYGTIPVAWAGRPGWGSAFSVAAVAKFPVTLESEPNDTPGQAGGVALPATWNGLLQKNGDRDLFQFEARKDEQLFFNGRTRSLGSPCDLFMQVLKPDGTPLDGGKVPANDDENLTNRIPADGRYYLLVEEATKAAGPNFAYQVEAFRQSPGFTLAVETNRLNIAAGGRTELTVTATRERYDGPIQLRIIGMNGKLAATDTLVAEKAKSARMILSETNTLAPGDGGLFRIEGEAVIEGRTVKSLARTMSSIRKQFPVTLHPPAYLDGWVAFAITPRPLEASTK